MVVSLISITRENSFKGSIVPEVTHLRLVLLMFLVVLIIALEWVGRRQRLQTFSHLAILLVNLSEFLLARRRIERLVVTVRAVEMFLWPHIDCLSTRFEGVLSRVHLARSYARVRRSLWVIERGRTFVREPVVSYFVVEGREPTKITNCKASCVFIDF